MAVKIQVLGIAEGGQHTAQIGGDVLEDEHQRHGVLLAGALQHEIAQRQKGQKGHVVGDEHGADEGDIHQRNDRHPQGFELFNDFSCQQIEKLDVFQGTNHRQHTKQAGQGAPVKIAQILGIGGHQKHGDERRNGRHRHHGISFHKGKHLRHKSTFFSLSRVNFSIAQVSFCVK